VNPLEKEQVVQRLINDIEVQAEESLKSLQWDAEAQRGAILRSIRKKAEEEAALYKEQELVDLRSNLIQNESQAKWKVKHDLLKRRAQLVDELFEEVRQDLLTFVKSDTYDAFHRDILEKLSHRDDIGHASLLVKDDEIDRFEAILQSLKLDFPVSGSVNIHIGGFILVSESGRLEIDHTLDTQLQSQREWFFNHSKLVL
jgi:vacuolar-type H+-ATPase subunit E/Vma4